MSRSRRARPSNPHRKAERNAGGNRNVLVIGMNLDKLKTTDGIDVAGKRVIVRADLNVPVKDGKVTDATRLERVMPGLKALADRGAKVIVISHFGRPKGGPQADLSLKPIADGAAGLLGRRVAFGADCIGETARRPSGRFRMAISPCSKISASTKAKKRMIRPSRRSLPSSGIFLSAMLFPARIGLTPRPRG